MCGGMHMKVSNQDGVCQLSMYCLLTSNLPCPICDSGPGHCKCVSFASRHDIKLRQWRELEGSWRKKRLLFLVLVCLAHLRILQCLASLWDTSDSHLQQSSVTAPQVYLGKFYKHQEPVQQHPFCQPPVNFVGTLVGGFLLASPRHLSKRVTTQQASSTYAPVRSEAVVGEEGTYFNVVLTLELWLSPRDESFSLHMLFLYSL